MKAEDYVTKWCDETYKGGKELGDWTTAEVMKFANDFSNEKLSNEAKKPPLSKGAVMPRLFFVVEEAEDGVWEQITIGLSTYEEAKTYKDRWNGKHPNAFIVASLNEA